MLLKITRGKLQVKFVSRVENKSQRFGLFTMKHTHTCMHTCIGMSVTTNVCLLVVVVFASLSKKTTMATATTTNGNDEQVQPEAAAFFFSP